jgi:PEP-CTERM motif
MNQVLKSGVNGGDGYVIISMLPEPAAWSLMTIGFGSLGYVLRRRLRQGGARATQAVSGVGGDTYSRRDAGDLRAEPRAFKLTNVNKIPPNFIDLRPFPDTVAPPRRERGADRGVLAMRNSLLAAAALAVLCGTAHAGGNLVANGSFTDNNLAAVAAAGYSGAEIDYLWNYSNGVPDWSSPLSSGSGGVYNIYEFGTPTTNPNADTRYTSSEAQHMNSNFTGDSPDGGAYMILDADPDFIGPLQQTVTHLTPGQKYDLSFYWAAGELSNRTGYLTSQLTGTFGGSAFATSVYDNTNPPGVPGSFSGWTKVSFVVTADSTSDVLSFLALGSPANNLPPVALLDGVSLTAVPEPATWGLLLLGVFGVGFAARRRAAAAAAG